MRQKHLATKEECERLARMEEAKTVDLDLTDAERFAAMDAAKAYWQMAQSWTESALYAEQVRPGRFTARNMGTQSKTADRQAFLREVAEMIGTRKHEAVAAQAIEGYPGKVLKLWRVKGESAERKVLNFIRNHGF